MSSIKQLQELFDDALGEITFPEKPKELYDPFRYILGLGGKRLRPLMLLMSCELFGENPVKALPQAIAVELFHNFTLIHDDIMDRAPLRRGLPAVHEKFSTPAAILSGDAMLVYSFKYLLQGDDQLSPVLFELLSECAVKVCEGQQMDMSFEKLGDINVSDYLHMIEMKTATLLATSLKIGALVGKASAGDAGHLYQFGRLLGISFQLKDDWLDSFGTSGKIGKQRGGDIIQNKKTFLLIECLNIADKETAAELRHWYSGDHFDAKEKVGAVLGIFKRWNIDVLAEKEIEKYFSDAMIHLQSLSIPQERWQNLRSMSGQLLKREQ